MVIGTHERTAYTQRIEDLQEISEKDCDDPNFRLSPVIACLAEDHNIDHAHFRRVEW
jgi:hypothetical protein